MEKAPPPAAFPYVIRVVHEVVGRSNARTVPIEYRLIKGDHRIVSGFLAAGQLLVKAVLDGVFLLF